MNSLEAIRALPKVELHVHVLGSIRPSTLLDIIIEDDIKVAYKTEQDIINRFQYTDFANFISVYMEIIKCIKDGKHFETITYEMLENCASCNTQYVELSFSPMDHIKQGIEFVTIVNAINKGIKRAHKEFGILTNIRVDLVRDSAMEEAMNILRSIKANSHNIVSIDIGGNESAHSPKPFAPVYKCAREMGLHLVAHAGEAAGPKSIWDAIRYLNVERIGHGVTAQEDPNLMEYLKRERIAIEMCPVSNLRTGVISSMRNHPIRDFFDRGLFVNVNSDDPSLFHTDLNNEYIQLHKHLDFTLPELFQISLNGVDAAFVNLQRKTQLRTLFIREYDRILELMTRY
ncbi:MAG: adenosine deaminase [Candidatus Thorarchaeota archaeon]|nr:adenosine deaminase [Candidatus Thorarchaeota archaeon]